MQDDSAFLAALRDRPHDLATRQIYADWLEEHGDPRADYLRWQCALEGLNSAAESYRQVQWQRERAFRRIDPEWAALVSRPNTIELAVLPDRGPLRNCVTFLVDGEDLCRRLLIASDHSGERQPVGYPLDRIVPATPGHVFEGVTDGVQCRQVLLLTYLGDLEVYFLSAMVHSWRHSVVWSNFETFPAFRAPLRAISPLVFPRWQYGMMLRSGQRWQWGGLRVLNV